MNYYPTFQFTPLREGRLIRRISGRYCIYFNSRPSARGDPRLSISRSREDISIHAPPRGATPRSSKASTRPRYFNSRPSARGDWQRRRGAGQGHISIHAPPRGATPPCLVARSSAIFQFTPLREGRLTAKLKMLDSELFQFTPLREGRRQKICNFCKSFVQPLQISMA